MQHGAKMVPRSETGELIKYTGDLQAISARNIGMRA